MRHVLIGANVHRNLLTASSRAWLVLASSHAYGCNPVGLGFLNPAGPAAASERGLFVNVILLRLAVIVTAFVLTPLVAWRYRYESCDARYQPTWTFSWLGGRDAFGQSKARAQAYLPAARYADIELPENSATVAIIGIAGAACGFGLIWHIGWLAISGVVAMWGAVIARSFARNTHQVIHADEVRRMHTGWLKRVGMCVAISRELETTSPNQGLARAGP